MCPICITSSSNRNRSRYAILADHIATVHDDGTVGSDENPLTSLSVPKTRYAGNQEVIETL